MNVSVVVTTYNWKEALGLTLQTVLQQSRLPAEVIIADDGSRSDTADLIKKMAAESQIPMIHSWQEDQGYRLAMSRNKAIALASSDYIIMIDGDLLLSENFIADHLEAARENCFVQGSRVLMNESLTSVAFNERRTGFSILNPGLGNRKNCLRSKFLSRIFTRRNFRLTGIRGCNLGFWRKDVVSVNGFNEEFTGWGLEDSEFIARMFVNGIARKNLRFMATAYHLFHSERSRLALPKNKNILEETIRLKKYSCTNGIDKYLK